MHQFDVFISYSSADRAEVEQIAQALRAEGLEVFFDRWHLTPGLDWRRRLEEVLASTRAVAVCLGAEMGGWQHREYSLAFARQTESLQTGQAFPVIPILLSSCQEPPSGFLRQNTWIDLRNEQQRESSINAIVGAVRGRSSTASDLGPASRSAQSQEGATGINGTTAPGATGDSDEYLCPYRGLRYFREEDAPTYFGREASVTQLLEVVKHRSVVAVLGASGTGKSSLVRAGLMPRLRRSATNTWEFCTLVPGHRPLRELAAAVVALLPSEQDDIAQLQQVSRTEHGLRDGSLDLPALVKLVLSKQRGTDRLLLFVDQWEEIYSPQCEPADRQIFIRNILEAHSEQVVKLLITLRADFFEEAITDSRSLADAIQGGIFALAPQTEAELRDSIVKPAAALKVPFEHGLPERLLADSRQQPGSLPLVEFVLEQLWTRRGDQQSLTHAGYEQIGGLSGAITAKAEELWASITATEQNLLKKAFIKLITPGTTTADTRRRATFDEFSPQTRIVLNHLIRGRLLTVSNADGLSPTTIEIAHEALLQSWGRLKGWIDEDRDFATWQAEVLAQTSRWEGSRRSATFVLRGAELLAAQKWRTSRQADISPQVLAFLRASRGRYLKVLMLNAGLGILILGVAFGWLVQFIVGDIEVSKNEAVSQRLISTLANDVVPILRQDGRNELVDHIVQNIEEFESDGSWLGIFRRDFEKRRADLARNRYLTLTDLGQDGQAWWHIFKTAMILQHDRNKYHPAGPDDDLLSDAFRVLGETSVDAGRSDEGLQWFKKARTLITEHPPAKGPVTEITAKILTAIASAQLDIESFAESLETCATALEVISKISEDSEEKPGLLAKVYFVGAFNKIELGRAEEAQRDLSILRSKFSQVIPDQQAAIVLDALEARVKFQQGDSKKGRDILERIGTSVAAHVKDLKSDITTQQLKSLLGIFSGICEIAISEGANDICLKIINDRQNLVDRLRKRNIESHRLAYSQLLLDAAAAGLSTPNPEVLKDSLIGEINREEALKKEIGVFPDANKDLRFDLLANLYVSLSRIEVTSGAGPKRGMNSALLAVNNARMSFKRNQNPKRATLLATALTARAEAAEANNQKKLAQEDYREALELYRKLLQEAPQRPVLLKKVAAIESALVSSPTK